MWVNEKMGMKEEKKGREENDSPIRAWQGPEREDWDMSGKKALRLRVRRMDSESGGNGAPEG